MSPPSWTRHLPAVVVLCVCGALPAPAADEPPPYVQVKGNARATVEGGSARGGPVELPLSGTLQVTLAVEGESSLEVAPLPTVTVGDGWTVHQPLASPTRTPTGAGRTRWQQTYAVEPLKPGEVGLPLPPLRFREQAEADWQTVRWDDVPVRVTTDVAGADLKELRDILPPERPPERPRWPWWPFLGGPLLLLALLAPALWLFLRRRPEKAAPLLPQAWAAAELDRLEALGLPAKGEINRYHTLLSDVVRRYLELRFQLHAPQQTTAEFLQAMGSAPQLGPAQQELLREFLGRCDLAKFAGATPSPEECQAAGAMARSFVEQTASAAALPEPSAQAHALP
jgi:hypothetical protein